MNRYFLIFACMLLVFCSMRTEAQVDCATSGRAELLHCDIPNDSNFVGLRVERGGNYHCYRMPTVVLRRANGSETVYNITNSKWSNNGQSIQTTFTGLNVSFVMTSTTGFSPLAGSVTVGNQTITFRTCGNQTSSAYYWTQSSQNPLEAFSCPLSKIPKGCPGVGYNP